MRTTEELIAEEQARASGPYQDCLDREPHWHLGYDDGNTARPPDARWVTAVHLVRRGYSAGPEDDAWTSKAVRFLKALVACVDEKDREQLARDMPDMEGAYRLHISNDKLSRGEVEARLLARQTFAEVAAACGMSPDVVEAYHHLYFDVCGKLKADAWIMGYAVGEKAWAGLTESDVDVLLKQYGYLKGPIVLETLARYFRTGLQIPSRLEGLSGQQLQELHSMLSMRTLVLARVLPFEQYRRILLLEELLGRLEVIIDSLPDDAQDASQAGWTTPLWPPDQEEWQCWATLAEAVSSGKTPPADGKTIPAA